MPAPSPLRSVFDLARAGNFPSVASNVVAALALSGTLEVPWWRIPDLSLALVAGILLYAGGATLNDVVDAAFDARHRPGRAIPTGVISRQGAAVIGAIELLGGAALLLLGGAQIPAVALLVFLILAYDVLHKRWAGSVLLMAGCRAALGVSLATLPGHAPTPLFWIWVILVFAYIVFLSLLARREYRLAGAQAKQVGRKVGRLLQFIPMVDVLALAALGEIWGALACALAIPLGQVAQRRAASN